MKFAFVTRSTASDGRLPSSLAACFFAALLLGLLFVSPPHAWGQDTGSEDAQPGDAAVSDAASSTTPEPTDAGTAADADKAGEDSAEEGGVYARIDKTFRDWVVTPIGNALFFSLGTEYIFGRKIPFVVLWLFVGAAFLTVRMGFINVRAFWHAIRLTKGDYDDPNDKGEVSHFQAFFALSATVGLGNIAGVAIAVGTGGPGAIFWMVLIGLLGMTSKFTECTLGQMYRHVESDGTVSGGPMRYLKDGLKELGLGWLGSLLAVFFTLLCIGASFGGGNSFQVGQSLDAIRADLPLLDSQPYLYGLLMAFFAGLVIIGGIRSIGRVASIIVPFMCAAYVAMALFILVTNASLIPNAFRLIFENAFSFQAGLAGLLGVMVVGIQRAVFSNEAGAGSAAIAHSAAKTSEPVSEGIVALLEPFIDTVVVCTMTGLVIIIAGGEWNPNEAIKTTKVGDPIAVAGAAEVVADEGPQFHSPSTLADLPLGEWSNQDYQEAMAGGGGTALTREAVSGKLGVPWFKWVLYAAVILFAFSTLVSWSYYGERCWVSVFGNQSSIIYKVLFLIFTVLGSIVTKGAILDFSDILILGMSLPNFVGLYLLSGKVRRGLDEYMGKVKSGEIAPHVKK